MNWRKLVTMLLAIMGGAAGGIAAGVLADRATSAPSPSSIASGSDRAVHARSPVGKPDWRVRELEGRLARVEAERPPSSEPGRAIATAVKAPARPTLEEAKRHHGQLHASRLAEHDSQGVDAQWALQAIRSFRSDLTAAAGEMHATVIDVDCRTTSCVATLEWPSHSEAIENWSSIMHARYELNCAKEIFLPDPLDPAAKYRATAIFDCSEYRGEN